MIYFKYKRPMTPGAYADAKAHNCALGPQNLAGWHMWCDLQTLPTWHQFSSCPATGLDSLHSSWKSWKALSFAREIGCGFRCFAHPDTFLLNIAYTI